MDTLEKNKKLVQQIEKLEEENRIYKEMLDETRTLIEVLQVMLPMYCTDTAFNVKLLFYMLYVFLQEQIEDERNDVDNSLDHSTL